MSIQLDGHLTYHHPAATAASGGTQPLATARVSTPTAPRGRPRSSAKEKVNGPAICWNGSWHYSQRQSRGSNASCSFKYFFVGPEVEVEAGKPVAGLAAAGSPIVDGVGGIGGNSVSASASVGAGSKQEEPGKKTRQAGAQHSGAEVSEQSGVAAADGSNQEGERRQPAFGSQQGITATVVTPTSAAAPTTGGQAQYANLSSAAAATASAAGEIMSKNPTKNPAAGAGTKKVIPLTPEQLTLYGPGGDGRLPSGKWSGHFSVKARGQDFLVNEAFVLEFGSGKSSPRSQSPTPPEVPAAPAGAATAARVIPSPSPPVSSEATAQMRPPPAEQKAEGATGTQTVAAAAASHSATSKAVAAAVAALAVPPVVRVSGWGENRYGVFTLTGGHERATGRLDLTRFYYDKPKSSGAGAGTGVSHQKKRRPLPLGAPPPPDPGPSLAERRTKRIRHPAQRLLDDEPMSLSHHAETSGSITKRKSEAFAAATAAAAETATGGPAGSPAADGSASSTTNGAGGAGGTPEAAGGKSSETPRRGSGSKQRKPRDRERDLLMEQNRRARRKAQQSEAFSGGSGTGAGAGAVGGMGSSFFVAEDAAVAELAHRARVGREALAGADLSALIGTDAEKDLVLKVSSELDARARMYCSL